MAPNMIATQKKQEILNMDIASLNTEGHWI